MNIAPQLPLVPGALPPPMAAPVTVGPLQVLANAAPSTFAELYSTPMANTHTGIYGPVLTLFTAHPVAGQ